ncbi:uncharacterized protein LOC127796879 [Diospyros lotus]|uniref:uncharacterized protein LOC127796879 n=1 Tax=Diospyros lotus TaxID=55363 RepID=UPI00224EEF21|nr:uncharacterized protein LOC127796879 [Diospyros lotus]
MENEDDENSVEIIPELDDYVLSRDKVRREIKPPTRYAHADIIAYALNIGDSIEHEEPVSYQEACSSNYKTNWLKAIKEEMESLQKNKTWIVVNKPKDQKVIGCKWIFKRKPGIPSVEPARFKARVVAKGFSQREGIDYYKVFCPVVKHSSIRRIPSQDLTQFDEPIHDNFPDEQLFKVNVIRASFVVPWYADIANYLATGLIPDHWSKQDRHKFFRKVRTFFWDEPYLFKYCPDQIIRRCIPDHEQQSVINFSHTLACGGHFSVKKTVAKIFQSGFYWPTLFKDVYKFCSNCDRCQRLGSLSRRNMMPLHPIQVLEVFDCWGMDFMGPFVNSFGHEYILLAVDYVSKWVEAIPVVKFEQALDLVNILLT